MKTSVKITVWPSYISQGYINICKQWWDLFPPLTREEVELEAKPMGVIQTRFYVEARGSHRGFSTNLRPWFKAHSELKAGHTLCITMIKKDTKYRLEIQLKQPKDLLP